ncbi:hypothetical protein KC363_g5414 [Hortaea werneckii]|uniref:Anaphase-promoting complex subunit 11 n=1 Tax=Hortaea werneckii TaxID=91943 RepID=A0A3M7FIY8_HORWE|nr:hypothetical protein KC361_g8069 [Hortaea werneckii]KAI7188478.1 hypothetical protein KC363_g5414 [Hortaea werneckii]KAI7508498.1 hypothetical protein KC347_g6028 [Hortaea werneckii]RMY88626.1 hypothetical protein D0861_04708 [Hortaea werneckii]
MGAQDVSVMSNYGYGSAHGSSIPPAVRPSPSDFNLQTQPNSRKRKAPKAQPKEQSTVIDLTEDEPPQKRKSKKVKLSKDQGGQGSKSQKTQKPKDEEKRLRRWRSHPPSSYLEVRERALTQRMFALDRQRDTSNPDHPTESISLAGTTGNVYTIVIDKVPSCNCPHARKGNQCKHIAYVLSRVLRAPAELEYQLAFTSAELRKIFEKAPPLPSETADASGAGDEGNRDGNRKPLEGECPICCVDFEPESGEVIVYCRAACGNNIHAECFKQWAATKRGGGNVTCPFCRSPWQGDEQDVKGVMKEGPRNAEGYVNVATQLGLSGRRDYSSYHSYWVRRQAMNGAIGWDEDGVMEHDY